ncbi:hypothetical protein N8772_01810 [Rickettsiales bacterium]|nr:hypothetical protein [Rickettsiales bacterium]
MQIKELSSNIDIKDSFKIMTQIYQELKEEDYISNITKAIDSGYKMSAVYKDTEIIAVIGINVVDDMRYGRSIRIEDFMICRSNRGIGAGKMLLKWVDWQLLKYKAETILSNLGSERKESHKIFLREGFIIDGIFFKK